MNIQYEQLPDEEANFNDYSRLWWSAIISIVLFTLSLFLVFFEGPRQLKTNNPLIDKSSTAFSKLAIDNGKCLSTSKNYDEPCEGPFLLMSFHGSRGGVNNVCKYTLSGCPMGAVLLPSIEYHPNSIRGMTEINGNLIVLEAHRTQSQLYEYGPCNEQISNMREPLRVLSKNISGNSGMIHPYGIAIRFSEGEIFVSSQGTNAVYHYDYNTGKPLEVSSYLQSEIQNGTKIFSNESVKLLDQLKMKKFSDSRITPENRQKLSRIVFPGQVVHLTMDSIRGVLILNDQLWVANKNKGVMLYNLEGVEVAKINVKSTYVPINLYHHDTTVFVGDSLNNTVLAIDEVTLTETMRFSSPELIHPSGIVQVQQYLYVISMYNNKMLRFHIKTGESQVILNNLPDHGEALLFTNC